MSMTLYQLKSFVTVAKHKSFTLAAETLRVRQPSMTLIIQNLERELDVKLFERLGNKIHLTNAGQELLKEAESIVSKAEGIKERMEDVKGLRKGKISVGGSALANTLVLPIAVQEFKKQHPGMEVVLRVERSNLLEKMLLEGKLDLAILGRSPCSPALRGELYHEEQIVAVASARHPLARKHIVPLPVIAQEPLILYEKGNCIRDMVEQKFNAIGSSLKFSLEVNLQLGSRDAVKNAVGNGLGITFLSWCHVESDIRTHRLKAINVPELDLRRSLYVTIHQKQAPSACIQLFVDLLRNHKNRLKSLSVRRK